MALNTFLDLIGEDRLTFVLHRLFQTFCGGFRLISSFDSFYPFPIILFQFIILNWIPMTHFLIAEMPILSASVGVSIAATLLLILPLQIMSYAWRNLKTESHTYSSRLSLFSKEMIIEIIRPKGRIVLLTLNIIQTIIYSGITAYYIHPSISKEVIGSESERYLFYSMSYLLLCGSSYSLISTCPPEPTQYLSNNEVPSPYSTVYMRPHYIILLFLVDLLLYVLDATEGCYWIRMLAPLLLLLWFFGCFPPLGLLITYSVEFIDVWLFGASSRGDDLRLYASFTLNILIVILSLLLIEFNIYFGVLFILALAFLISFNIFALFNYCAPCKTIAHKKSWKNNSIYTDNNAVPPSPINIWDNSAYNMSTPQTQEIGINNGGKKIDSKYGFKYQLIYSICTFCLLVATYLLMMLPNWSNNSLDTIGITVSVLIFLASLIQYIMANTQKVLLFRYIHCAQNTHYNYIFIAILKIIILTLGLIFIPSQLIQGNL